MLSAPGWRPGRDRAGLLRASDASNGSRPQCRFAIPGRLAIPGTKWLLRMGTERKTEEGAVTRVSKAMRGMLPVLLLAGCAGEGGGGVSSPAPEAAPARTASGGQAAIYRCGDRRVLARFEGGDVLIDRWPAPPLRLTTTRSASGARYAGGGTVFWTKRDEAVLEVEGEGTVQCRRQTVPVRAVGQEPGWLLEITPGGRMEFTGDYGDVCVVAPTPLPDRSEGAGRRVYRAGAGARGLAAVFEERACRDTMSGSPYPFTVTVTLDGRTHEGCGDIVPSGPVEPR
jgi:uncharacterized membrane protein